MRKLAVIILFLSQTVFAENLVGKSILAEYQKLRSYVETLEHDSVLAGYKVKDFGNYSLLWKLDSDLRYGDKIRFFRPGRNGEDSFSVSYWTGTSFVKGVATLRRSLGLERTGWRNHTIGLEDAHYYGSQGYASAKATEEDLQILREWGINLFNEER